ncbi:uncharacterized protein LOC116430122 isoform X2 [Nomia melanderi]|uniref:uncharacterized protein LOC116430122 isoform X2 n=1 Tax=Nomia melanderi TaxID=2448451 RepID=UPI00130454CA|nr:RNA exonuclease 1 homolog isoform X2 [Nomia melanderi]
MLPSTGYFKAINCPFYESGSCDRPYCHFKHSKREDAVVTTETAETLESHSSQVQEAKAAPVRSDSDMLQQLVTEAVKKVLANQEVTSTDKFSCQNVVSRVVEGLKPSLNSGTSGKLEIVTASAAEEGTDVSMSINKSIPCVYNPTPIAELKKRHIPIISYMPTRESRVAVKRKCSPEGVKPWLGSELTDSQAAEAKYKPTTIVNTSTRDTTQSYIPTCKADPVLLNSMEDGNSSDYALKLGEAYYPKSKKRREEYVPKKIKAPLKSIEGLKDSAVYDFTGGFNTANQVSANASPSSNFQRNDESEKFYSDLEPKFSDDEEDVNNSRDDVGHSDCDSSKVNGEGVDDTITEQGEIYDDANSGYLNDEQSTRTCSTKISVNVDYINNENCDGKDSKDSNILTQEVSIGKESLKSVTCVKGQGSETDASKGAEKTVRYKCKRSNKSKDPKSYDNSRKHSTRYKEGHISVEKSHSAYRGTSKDESHRRGESKDLKSKDRERNKYREKNEEKHRCKERNRDRSENRRKSKSGRRDSRDSGKHRGARDSSESSKKEEHVKKRRGGSKRSSFSGKSDDDEKTFGQSSIRREENNEERNSVERLASPSESIRSKLDGTADEETDERRNSIVGNDIEDVIISGSDSDHDVQEECLKIFQEYQVSERSKVTVSSRESSRESSSKQEKEQNEELGRRRVAHPSAATCVTRQTVDNQLPKKLVNPQQKMYERWRLMRDVVAEKAVPVASNVSVSKDVQRRNHVEAAARVRIAHVPYAKSLAIEKKKMTENAEKSTTIKVANNSKTTAQTAKSGVRVAHVPQAVPQLIRPEPLQVTTQKFPLNVRQYYVNIMHDVCVQIYTNAEDAAQRAIKEEYACHERCKALAVYKSSCMLAAHRLRKEIDQSLSTENNTSATTAGSSVVSHEAVLAGKAKGSWSVLKTKRSVTEFRGTKLYNMLKKWILSEEQLRDNGFPRPHPDGQKGRAKIYVTNSRNQNALSKVPNERICSRCGQAYTIDKQGFPLRPQNCIYHWGRKFTVRGEGKYSCCQQYGSATGCCDAKTHVWEYTDYENLRGYVKTLPKDISIEEQGIYALDCEMSYTTQGLELTRVTVIDEDCSVVYETLVKPQNPIIDYNTRFSGITEESMKDVTTTLLDVQATLLTMFSEKTILVGHSLESDFKALRLLHDTVVDTSVMFPHKNGYPQKRALKNLCSEYLRKIIQNDVGGHDSKEDAVSCMELILWKAKEIAKLQ